MRSEARLSPEAEYTVWWLLLCRAVERAARAAALDDVVAGIRAVQSSYDDRYGRPNVAGSACSDCIGAVNALRARAEGDGEGGR